MDTVLHDALFCSRAYIDDIVSFSSSWDEHMHLLCVLQALREAALTLNPTKCEWAVASCTCLGYIVGQGFRRTENC